MLITWVNNGPIESRLYWSIFTLFLNHPSLLDFLFDSEKASLRKEADELIKETAKFSSAEHMLVRVALDLWCGMGEANILEVFETLDAQDCRNFIRCLHFYAEDLHKTRFNIEANPKDSR